MAEEKYDPKTFKMYMKVALDTQDKSMLTSYFLINFIVNKAVEYLKAQRAQGQDDQELTRDVQGWFQLLEELKKAVGAELQDREECKKQYYEYAYSTFLRADNKYRDDDWSPQLAQEFFYATVLLDGYGIFGALTGEVATHKKYAKVARLKILKAIKAGTMPVPKLKKPPSETEVPEDNTAGIKAFGNFQPNQSSMKNQPNNVPGYSGNQYGNPYGQGNPTSNPGYGGYGEPSYPKDNFGQGNAGGLPAFNKFDGGSNPTGYNVNLGGNYPTQNAYNPSPSANVNVGYGNPVQGQPAQPKSTQPRRGADFYQKAEKAKDLCKKALGELEYKRVRQFKENLESALELLESIQ